jgi:dihydrofolate reductase
MTPRPTCCVFIATSLDGYIAGDEGSLDFLKTVERPGEDYGYAEFAETIDTLIIGRKTYDTVLAFDAWPYAGKRVLVATHHHEHPRHGEEFVAGSPIELLSRLPAAARAYVDGGELIRQFFAASLVDELTLNTIPLVLGSGIPLFSADAKIPPLRFTHVATRHFPSGLVQSKYRALQ